VGTSSLQRFIGAASSALACALVSPWVYAEGAPALAAPAADASLPLVFATVNPRLGSEGGIRTFDSLGRLVFSYSDAISPGLGPDESSAPGKALGVLGRLGKAVFFDEPLSEFEGTAIHEVFGHGSRSREVGLKASYTFTLPGVYCFLFSSECGARGHTLRTDYAKTVDAEIAVVAGGIEANYATAHWINARTAAQSGLVRYDDAMLYTLSKLQYAGSLLTVRGGSLTATVANDVDNYALLLADRSNRVSDAERTSIGSRLALASLWNLADPMLLASVYGLVVRYVGLGERTWTLPLPKVLGATVFAVPRFNLSPFGAEHYLDGFVHRGSFTANSYVRVGSSGLGSYLGAGARVFQRMIHDRVYGGAEVDVWRQPELLLQERAVYMRRELWGWNAGISLEWRIHQHLGILGRAAYKTRGHMIGQPLDEGVHGYLGLSFSR